MNILLLTDFSDGGGNEASCVVRLFVFRFPLSSIVNCVANPTDITPTPLIFDTLSNITGIIHPYSTSFSYFFSRVASFSSNMADLYSLGQSSICYNVVYLVPVFMLSQEWLECLTSPEFRT